MVIYNSLKYVVQDKEDTQEYIQDFWFEHMKDRNTTYEYHSRGRLQQHMIQYINFVRHFRHLCGVVQVALCINKRCLYDMLNLGIYILHTHTFIYGICSHVIGQLDKEKDYYLRGLDV